MAWDSDMVDILRVMVNDIAGTTYTDDTMERTLVVAARMVSNEMTFSQDFTGDIANIVITPDPTIDPTKDESFVNLTTLKAACIVNQGAALVAAKQAIGVADGSSRIDLRERGNALLKLLAKGWCSTYEDAKYEYKTGLVRVAAAVVMGPFRLFAQGSSAFGLGPMTDRWGRTTIY